MKRKWLLVIISAFLCVWVFSVVQAAVLTKLHGQEFSDPESVGCDWLQGYWTETPELRVLRYSKNRAVVYYYFSDYGEKNVFVKRDGQWEFEDTVANWTDAGGSADNYLIWPYWKNLVI